MEHIFSFETKWPAKGQPKRIRVFFTSDEQLDPAVFSNEITTTLDLVTPPDLIVILTIEKCEATVKSTLSDQLFQQRLPDVTKHPATPPIALVHVRATGDFQTEKQEHRWLTEPNFRATIIHDGLVDIFLRRKGIIQSSQLFHFAKPSGRHSAEFIRTAELLISDPEISFVAVALLPWLSKVNLHYIFCDTSSIGVVGYAAAHILRSLTHTTTPPPRVHTFSSYDGVRNLDPSVRDNAIYLISASTSGGLANEVLNKAQAPKNRVVTMFYLGEKETPGDVLCDLQRPRSGESRGLDPIKSHSEVNCPLCASGSASLQVLGDQFLLKEAKVDVCTIRAAHAPNWLSPLLEELHGKKIIRCFYDWKKPDRPRELYLALEPIFDAGVKKFPHLSERLERIALQSIPAALRQIVHLDDPGSAELAKYLKRLLKLHGVGLQNIKTIAASQLTTSPQKYLVKKGATLVVANCIITGRSLQAVSQCLRTTQLTGSVSYFVAIPRTQTEKELEEIRSNLCFGKTGPKEHPFIVCQSIFVPDGSIGRQAGWTEEFLFLNKAKDKWKEKSDVPLPLIEARLQELAEATSQEKGGLINNVFLKKQDGSSLALRREFAFFRFRHNPGQVSQSEVYFTIAAVVHDLRNRDGKHDAIKNHIHHRTLLSPRCFDRFNDGIIQAAILRAALRAELDYRLSRKESTDMREIIATLVRTKDSETGEAYLEFLLALAMEKIRLNTADISWLCENVFVSEIAHPDAQAIIALIPR